MIELFHSPGACSRVTMTALEEIGLPFEDVLINTGAGRQKSPEYLAINPKGKVPALRVDGRVMTENAAILSYLDRRYPDAQLLPHDADPVVDNQGLIDIVWCSSTLHPIARQIRRPVRFTTGAPEGVREDGIAKLRHECAMMSERIGDRWWYGDRWSIVDTYLCWAYGAAELGGFPLGDYPVLAGHAERVQARSSYQRALAREGAAVERENIADPKP